MRELEILALYDFTTLLVEAQKKKRELHVHRRMKKLRTYLKS